MTASFALRKATICFGCIAFVALGLTSGFAQQSAGKQSVGQHGVPRTTAEIMAQGRAAPSRKRHPFKRELEIPHRENRPQDPGAPMEAQWPLKTVLTSRSSHIANAPPIT